MCGFCRGRVELNYSWFHHGWASLENLKSPLLLCSCANHAPCATMCMHVCLPPSANSFRILHYCIVQSLPLRHMGNPVTWSECSSLRKGPTVAVPLLASFACLVYLEIMRLSSLRILMFPFDVKFVVIPICPSSLCSRLSIASTQVKVFQPILSFVPHSCQGRPCG